MNSVIHPPIHTTDETDRTDNLSSKPYYIAKFADFLERMIETGLNRHFIDGFHTQYLQLLNGETGLIPESSIKPIENLPTLEPTLEIVNFDNLNYDTVHLLSGHNVTNELKTNEIDYDCFGENVLHKLVVIKLNGGLGTSMGLDKAKTLLRVKNDLTFLDIISKQLLAIRSKYKTRLPLILMNSFRTIEDSERVLSSYSNFREGQGNIPTSFIQHKVPKILVDNLDVAKCPSDSELEWCPPGHGDIYSALLDPLCLSNTCNNKSREDLTDKTTELQDKGLLDTLLDSGFEYAFVSNADNLGATVSTKLLGYLASRDLPFLMEATTRTAADSKGGHLAQIASSCYTHTISKLVLREIAQCPESDLEYFQNIERHKFFNTNSIWLNLKHLKDVLNRNNNYMPLPIIRNLKNLDPTDASSPKVYQIETAMGAAISCFTGAEAINVHRSRFAPVKKTEDLLALWSDIFLLTDNGELIKNPQRKLGAIVINLDPKFFKFMSDFEKRFSDGIPSMIDCESLTVKGDVYFGPEVVIRGKVIIENISCTPLYITHKCLDSCTHRR